MVEQAPRQVGPPRTSPQELKVRLEILKADAAAERHKSIMLFGAGLVAAVGIGGVCIWIIVSPNSAQNTVRWATATLTSIVTGIVGYVSGRSASRA